MSISVQYDHIQHIIEFVVSGNIQRSEMELVKSKGIELSLEHGCYDFLIDSSAQEKVESILPYYEFAESGYAEEGLDGRSRAAIILPKLPESRRDLQFYEDACRNRCWEVRSFEDRGTAIEWLKTDASSETPGA